MNRHKFLRVLTDTANVAAAARAADTTRAEAYQLRQADDAFRDKWDEALNTALENLERDLRERALEGTSNELMGGDDANT